MKWVLVLCVMLSLSLVSGHTSFELAEGYSPEHTLVMALPDSFIGELDKDAVHLYRDGHVAVPWEYGVNVRGNDRYIWGVTPRTVGNYSIVIEDALILKEGTPVVEDVSYSFMVRGNSSLYAFTPGVIDLNMSSVITVTSRADSSLVVSVESDGEGEITLLPGKNTINLSKLGIGFKDHFILGEYDVPVLSRVATSSGGVLPAFTLSPGSLSFRGGAGSTQKWNVTVLNEHEEDQKITITFNTTLVSVSPTSLSLDADESETIFISLTSPLRTSFTSVIMVTSGNYSYPLTLAVVLTEAQNTTNRERDYSALLCPEVPGFICRGEQTCGGETYAVGGLNSGEVCCAVSCTSQEESGSWTPWVLFLLACALAGGAYYYYRVKEQPNAFQEQVKHAEKKVHP